MANEGWIDMRERRPTEQDALMWAGGELAVLALVRYAHGYFMMLGLLGNTEYWTLNP